MKENILINSVKEARIYYKERKHKKEAEAYLENISNKKISKEYKKAIDEYWSRYRIKVSGRWHHLFALCSGIEDVRYIDVGLFYSRIIGRLNFQRFSEAYDDKCRYDAMFDDIKQPKTIVKNVNGYFFDEAGYVISKDTAETAIREYGKCIAKPSIGTSGGHGIVVLNRTDEVNYKEGLNKLLNKKNYIVQEFIGQNPVLMDLNPSSVNTIRLMSFLWKGEVYILAQHLRIGNKGSEFVSCTTECRGIEAGGLLSDISHTADYRMRKCVVGGGSKAVLPNYQSIVDYVKNKHKKICYFSIIGWDFTIDKEGEPVLIEINTKWPGIDTKQCLYGPLFGELTDEVMEYVFSDKQAVLDGVSIIL